ncbi:MAG: hypothetical protein V3R85_06270 [Alphaproteobacteria bacterium]
MSHDVSLVGSVPLGTARAVFEAVGDSLGGTIRRIPDGEGGERLNWALWQAEAFERIPFVEEVPWKDEGDPAVPGGGRGGAPHFRVKPGFPTAAVRFGPLGYAASARASHAEFIALRDAGRLAANARLQIGMATALSVVGQHVDGHFQQAIEPSYEKRLLEEVDEIAANLPHGDIAIQWNLAAELSIIEGHRPIYFDKIFDGILDRMARLCEQVPDDIELGLHFCLHDFTVNGFPLPDSLDGMVDLANGIMGTVARSVEWIHLAVPRKATEAAFFAPLERLTQHPETELYLGLIHPIEGLDGVKRRIALAASPAGRFGLAGECGFGPMGEAEVAAALDLHREAAALD